MKVTKQKELGKGTTASALVSIATPKIKLDEETAKKARSVKKIITIIIIIIILIILGFVFFG